MSAVARSAGATTLGGILWAELRKLLSRPIARAGLVLMAVVGATGPVGLWVLLHSGVQVNGGELASNFDVCAPNTIGWSLHVRNFFVAHVLLTVFAALSFAGEYQSHALREDLVRPVPRSVVLLAKWFALAGWSLTAMAVQLAVAAGLAVLLQPLHGEATWSQVLLAYLEAWVAEVGFAAFALAASVVVRSVAGTLLTVFLFLVFEQGAGWVLGLLGQFVSAVPAETNLGPLREIVKVTPFLPSSAWAVWTEALAGAAPTWQAWTGLLVYTAVALVVADRLFARVDVP
jgi:ABC-type transport system involved in multi-copper enzyme maturation permease subunit